MAYGRRWCTRSKNIDDASGDDSDEGLRDCPGGLTRMAQEVYKLYDVEQSMLVPRRSRSRSRSFALSHTLARTLLTRIPAHSHSLTLALFAHPITPLLSRGRPIEHERGAEQGRESEREEQRRE